MNEPPIPPPPPPNPPPFSQVPPSPYGPGGQIPGAKKNNTLLIILLSLGGGMFFCCIIGAAVLFPVFQQAKRAAQRSVRLSHLKQIGLGCLMYANDHNEKLPNFSSMPTLEQEIGAYVKSDSTAANNVFTDPITKQPFELNDKLSGANVYEMAHAENAVLAYSSPDEGICGAAFADGHAKSIPMDELSKDLENKGQ